MSEEKTPPPGTNFTKVTLLHFLMESIFLHFTLLHVYMFTFLHFYITM